MHRRFRFLALLASALLVLALYGATASAQGATVFFGTVTIDGQPAPAGTVVQVIQKSNNRLLGSGTTGDGGQAANRYRIDVQATSDMDGQPVAMAVVGKTVNPPVTTVFQTNRAFELNIAATATAPTPTATALPAATATPVATATAIPPTATTAPAPTATVAALATATTAPPVPTATVAPAATATPAKKGGGCNAPPARTGEMDLGWVLIGLVGPGIYFARKQAGKKD